MKFVCHLTDKTLKKTCTVKTCMWWSTNAAGCMAHDYVPDPEDMTDEIVAQHKGLTVKEVSILRKRGARTIERALILYRYFDWIGDTLKSHQFPYVDGYNNPELISAVAQLTSNRWPFTIPYLDWNIGKVYCCLSSNLWKRYSKTVNTEIDGLRIMGVDKEEARVVVNKYRAAARLSKGV